MSYLAVSRLSVGFRQFRLHEVSLLLERGQTLVVLGPSGAGKSVLLETIAGFHPPAAGRLELDGQDLAALPPEARGLGFMFQDYALFPHLTVEQNVAFGVRRRADAARRVAAALERVGAGHLRRRRPATLSGGEKQRVALARALAIEPRLFLFDEPLSAVDAAAREELRDELRRLLRSLEATSLYVTHDRTEALVLADVVAILAEGVVRQVGAPEEVFARPVDSWVAQFVGMEVLCPDAIELFGAGCARVHLAGGTLVAAANGRIDPRTAQVAVRPEDIHLERPDGGRTGAGGLAAVVEGLVPLGPLYRVHLAGGVSARALLTRQECQRLLLRAGDAVRVHVQPEHLVVVPAASRHG